MVGGTIVVGALFDDCRQLNELLGRLTVPCQSIVFEAVQNFDGRKTLKEAKEDAYSLGH